MIRQNAGGFRLGIGITELLVMAGKRRHRLGKFPLDVALQQEYIFSAADVIRFFERQLRSPIIQESML